MSRAGAAFQPADSVTGTVRMPDPRTIHWRLPENYFEPKTLLAILRSRLFGVRDS